MKEARLVPIPNVAQRASRGSLPRHRGWAISLAVLVGIAAAIGPSAPATAASAAKVAIIVGPAGSATAGYRRIADQAAAEARRYTPNVVRVYSPNATWSSVSAAINGAAIVVYAGLGRGFPSPYATTLQRATQDGFGLNPVAGVDNSTIRYYGEAYVRKVPLARHAVVLLSHVPYASGTGESGAAQPALSVARGRVDGYGAGFLAAGASAVIAELTSSPVYYIRAIFTRTMSLDAMWRGAPGANGHITSFTSLRTTGAVGRTDPDHASSGGYDRSEVGRLAISTATVRGSIGVSTPPPSPSIIAVPSSIDATGSTDASAALNSFVGTVADGSTIVFKAGGVYRMDGGLTLSNRHNLIFEGGGATLRGNGVSTCGRDCSLFFLRDGNKGITIRNFILVGNSPTPGIFDTTLEQSAAITIVGGSQVEIANVTISRVGGDGLTLSGDAPDWPNGIWFHDSHVISSGRSGVAVIAGRNVTVERVAFDESGYTVLDLEPNVDSQGASNVRFLDNTAGTWANSFLSADGAVGSIVNGVTVSGNTVTGGSLLAIIDLSRRQNVVFTNNTSTVAAAGPVLRFAHIDGLTVTGNVQPLSSGVLASITDSTGVTMQ